MFQDAIANMNQLAHRSAARTHLTFAVCEQTIVLDLDVGVLRGGNHGREEQRLPEVAIPGFREPGATCLLYTSDAADE